MAFGIFAFARKRATSGRLAFCLMQTCAGVAPRAEGAGRPNFGWMRAGES